MLVYLRRRVYMECTLVHVNLTPKIIRGCVGVYQQRSSWTPAHAVAGTTCMIFHLAIRLKI
jgi:hypothetical protein